MKRIISLLLILPMFVIGASAEQTDPVSEEEMEMTDEVVELPEGEEALAAWIAEQDEESDLAIEAAALLQGEGAIAVSSPSALLMEQETGTVIFEKNAHEKYAPASVTKIMTMLLVVEAIENGSLGLADMVTTSEHASSMGGTQIYLAENEQMSVSEMLKSVAVGSANDAAVALAEHIAGSEDEFVRRMNERALQLGMQNTEFHNCTGLPASPGNMTSSYDIALMSRELMRHKMIKDFTMIWMDTVRNGTFGLANTNKLIYYYEGATGLKTGYTLEAMHCVSATAERDGVSYIAVVMHDETSAGRFGSAKAMLNYAFANYTVVRAIPDEALPPVQVKLGNVSWVQGVLAGDEYLLLERADVPNLSKTVEMSDGLTAPIAAGDEIGTLTVRSGDTVIKEVPVVAVDSVDRIGMFKVFVNFLRILFTGAL